MYLIIDTSHVFKSMICHDTILTKWLYTLIYGFAPTKERAINMITDEIHKRYNIRDITPYVLSFPLRSCRKEETVRRSGNVHFAWELRINYEDDFCLDAISY